MKLSQYYSPSFPQTVQEFKSRGWDLTETHLHICQAFNDNLITRQDIDNLAPLIKVIGFEENLARYVLAHWDDATKDREAIMAITFHTKAGEKFFDEISEEERVKSCGPWVRPMMKAIDRGDPFPKYALAMLVKTTTENCLPFLVAKFEESRLYHDKTLDVYSECNKIEGFADLM